MRLHENKELFRQAVQFTSQQMGIPEIYVEKDYWVTFILHAVFSSPIGTETVFKGGTSLLKCHGHINRFSEDVDLIALRKEGETDNKLKSKLKKISKVISDLLPEVEVADVTRKMGMTRKTAHSYAKEFDGNYGQVRDVIIVEATWLGYFEPYTILPISSFIYDMMIKNGQSTLAQEYGLHPFEAKVLVTNRTFCEKIMSLVRFSYSSNPVNDLKKKIRHTYDLHQLLQDSEIEEFFESPRFDEMLLRVAKDDVKSFRNNNAWLAHHPSQALMFSDLEKLWSEMKSTYNGGFKLLVFGENIATDEQILSSLVKIKSRLDRINWDITIPPSSQEE
ncbi:nucleotidyl transferase AbiEii/AbiGii toxin family protein [Algoriphagus sp. AGSA1]|uniref:nucleotidyl transferase AbiEii/AbiGii toxin family protein n=1 Tax=Algoriphagus sp. AGSA1 TaxID=2907213 RepID=UPI001F28A27D|nr:nucleotidyl transferase AbiEii/AbiGii toxin family protein [Algoriphagus sp. AGSA1]MCE7056894.1 nucleotidyl transferase AbiEii/AbiGii toxin family protein [Algoriphagus sp. AGSA1]